MQENEKKPVRWPDLHALYREIGALEVQAGIFESLAKVRWGPAYRLDLSPNSPRELLHDEYEPVVRFVARQLYFGVEETALRTQLICKQRELEHAYKAVYDDAITQARKTLTKAEGQALPGATIGLLAAIYMVTGAGAFDFLGALAKELFRTPNDRTNLGIYGALAGALFGFFYGLQLMDRARAARTEAIRIARVELEDEPETKKQEYKPTASWFTYGEERSCHRAGAVDAKADIDAAAKRRAAYDTLARRTSVLEIFRMQSKARFGWEALLSPEQIANFGMSDNFEPISQEQYVAGLEMMKSGADSPNEDR